LLAINICNEIYSLIVIPIKTIENNIVGINEYSIANHIISNVLIGKNEQLIDVFYTSNMYTYYFDEQNCLGNNYYDNNLSSYNLSLKNYIIIDDDEKAIQVNESIYFFKDLNLTQRIEINDFPILVRIDEINSQKLCLLIGLLFRVSGPLKILNFIEELKKQNAIESYTWTIQYTSEKEGLFIIGEEPHIYDPEKYNETHLRTINPTIIENSYNWNIKFNKIYSGNNLISENNFCMISHEIKYIMGTKEYNESIVDNFFKEYINNNICNYHHDSFSQSYYYCDKKLFSKNDINKFPILLFFNIYLEEKFIFKGEELFFEGKDFYFFKIYFNEFSQRSWLIGKLFLEKYQLIFNHDKKLIGYYRVNLTNDNEEKIKNSPNQEIYNNNNINKILYIIFGILLLIIIGVLILLINVFFKPLCCNKQRKKLVNELVDEEEFPDKENENEKRNKDQLIDINF
jgi:hypothetical protein